MAGSAVDSPAVGGGGGGGGGAQRNRDKQSILSLNIKQVSHANFPQRIRGSLFREALGSVWWKVGGHVQWICRSTPYAIKSNDASLSTKYVDRVIYDHEQSLDDG